MTTIPFLDAAAVHRRAPWDRLIDAMEAAHRRERMTTGQLRLVQPYEGEQPDVLILSPAWDRERAMGVKLVTSFPRNQQRYATTTVGSVYVVFDPLRGKPILLLDGEAMIFRKTAADSALGVRLLARPDARRMLMLGAGALAPFVIEAVHHVRPAIDQIHIWNRTAAKAEALAADCRARGLPAVACLDADRAQAEADIVMSATMAEAPIIKGACLRPGTHVGMIGSFTPAMREGDDALLGRGRIYVDDFKILEESGEFTGPLERGVIARSDVLGDLYALCQGRCPLPGPTEISVFKNGGIAHLDLITAQVVASADAAPA